MANGFAKRRRTIANLLTVVAIILCSTHRIETWSVLLEQIETHPVAVRLYL
jgi:hypothetical protein